MTTRKTTFSIALTLLVGVAIGFTARTSTTHASSGDDKVRLEYRVESVSPPTRRQYEKLVGQCCRDGWRLVEVDGNFLFFERARSD